MRSSIYALFLSLSLIVYSYISKSFSLFLCITPIFFLTCFISTSILTISLPLLLNLVTY